MADELNDFYQNSGTAAIPTINRAIFSNWSFVTFISCNSSGNDLPPFLFAVQTIGQMMWWLPFLPLL